MTGPTVQSAGFLLELSPDWLIRRASQNAHAFLGEYHQRLIGEPLSNYTLAQSLHDLRNSLARQRSCNGIARAYRVRLIDEPRYFDIAFQSSDSAILLEGVPSSEEGYGGWLGSISRLIDGLKTGDRGSMLDGAARRMRALTGFDRVTLTLGEDRIESSRGRLPALEISGNFPALIADTGAEPVGLFPDVADDGIEHALLRSPGPRQLEELRSAGVASALSVPIVRNRQAIGHFECTNGAPREPSFERHAAAELFAQLLGMMLTDD